MKALTEDNFAPITTQVGFVELPLREVSRAYEAWKREHHDRVNATSLNEPFPDVLHRLEPLVGGARPRTLLVAVGAWTAYFDCSLRGTDPEMPIGYLSEKLGCAGVQVMTAPHTIGQPGVRRGRAGGMLFRLFGPLQTQFLNYVRTVSVIWDGRWHFHAIGTPQAFEEQEAYASRQLRDRLTSDMIERYCMALGLDVFNPRAYGPEAVFFETDARLPENPIVMSLEEAQRALEISPGVVASMPG